MKRLPSHLGAVRYGPPPDLPPSSRDDPSGDNPRQPVEIPDEEVAAEQRRELRGLVDRIASVSDPMHVPSLLTRHMDLLLALSTASQDARDGAAVVESVLNDVEEEQRGNGGKESAPYKQCEEAVDLILSFTEEFVNQTVTMEEYNKKLLGKIILAVSDKDKTTRQREEKLDSLLARERDQFTSAGFLRHLELECNRIANARTMSPESTRLLEILRMIQARVLEEVGDDLGEAAQVLGQLIGYESKAERTAVLEAGLAVRGVDFAEEMLSLAEEALDGFQRVPGGADPDLVECVSQVKDRVQRFCDEEMSFQ